MEGQYPIERRVQSFRNYKMCLDHEQRIYDIEVRYDKMSTEFETMAKDFKSIKNTLNKMYLLGWVGFTSLLAAMASILFEFALRR